MIIIGIGLGYYSLLFNKLHELNHIKNFHAHPVVAFYEQNQYDPKNSRHNMKRNLSTLFLDKTMQRAQLIEPVRVSLNIVGWRKTISSMNDVHFNKGEKFMRALCTVFLITVIALGNSACTIPHVIEKDYTQYLVNNTGASNLSKTDKASEYVLTPNTQKHRYEFRAAASGIANLWIVEFGKMLDDTLMSTDVQKAFGALQKVSDTSSNSKSLLIFDLQSYTFKNYGAHLSLKVALSRSGQVVFSKTYKQDGKAQVGKMLMGGVFAQKNAVQQSTKLALDEVLRQLISDLNMLK